MKAAKKPGFGKNPLNQATEPFPKKALWDVVSILNDCPQPSI